MRALAAVLAVVLVACQVAPVETPDPAAIPSGSLEPGEQAPIGPIIEVGSGSTAGVGWRFAAYESASGWCMQLETQTSSETGCGDPLPTEDEPFGFVSKSGTVVHGVASAETATVFLILNGVGRVPATMMSLESAGIDAVAFVGVAPVDAEVTHVQAVKLNGDVLDSRELP